MSMMLNSLCIIALLLLCSCQVSLAGRKIPSSAPSTVVRPLAAEDDRDYVNLRPRLNQKGGPIVSFGGDGGREVKGCLPKGFRHASAPSRFVNYHPLGSAGCNTSSDVRAKKP